MFVISRSQIAFLAHFLQMYFSYLIYLTQLQQLKFEKSVQSNTDYDILP